MSCAKACVGNDLASDALGACLRACTSVADEVAEAELQSMQSTLVGIAAAAQLGFGLLMPSIPPTPPTWGSPVSGSAYSTPSYPTYVRR